MFDGAYPTDPEQQVVRIRSSKTSPRKAADVTDTGMRIESVDQNKTLQKCKRDIIQWGKYEKKIKMMELIGMNQ